MSNSPTTCKLPYVAGAGELAVFCGALIGAGLGFLWFNTYPAQVFMGDVGALALGAALGVVAVIVRHEIVLLIMGRIVRRRSRLGHRASGVVPPHRQARVPHGAHSSPLRIARLAGTSVIVRMWIVALVMVLIGLSTLKLR